MMDLGLLGRTALVTGAGRGLGAEIAVVLATEGASVLSVSRSEAALRQNHSRMPESGRHDYLALDLADPANLPSVLEWVEDRQVQIDIVINNVGGTLSVDDPLATADKFLDVMWLNLGVAIELNRHFVPAMSRQRWGRICHVSSISAIENQGPPAYCAAKAATNAYVRSVGRFLAKDNVIVTGVMPGAVFTEGGYWDVASKTRPEHVARFLSERMAIGRFGTEHEIAQTTAFLVSDAASFLVGSVMLADGGQGRSFHNEVL